MRRFFGKREKLALWIAAEGKCEACGCDLATGWHADHIEPWTRGGETDVVNGRATCASCNLKKGGMVMERRLERWPYEFEPLAWQADLWRQYGAVRMLKRDFLAAACPASGKTMATLPLIVDLLAARAVLRVVVVCPTDEVCEQWQKKAAEFGIQLERSGSETKEFDGVVVTYQQVVSGWEMHRRMCRQATVVVFDEIHHCADQMAWGDVIRQAFDEAAYRIGLSGTPFRHDSKGIPFVTYEDEICQPDFTYSYGQALDDQIVRLAFFPTLEGSAEWLQDGQRFQSDFRQATDAREQRALMRALLDPRGDWIGTTIQEARQRTEICRRLGHGDAGELWICKFQDHAYAIAERIARMTGEEPVIVTSDDARSREKIEAFRQGSQRCLVSVKQVSEGVDIPRLRVLVYATNVLTELFFRQALGRILRKVADLDEQCAYFYLPRHPLLEAMALQIREERLHHLRRENNETEEDERERERGAGGQPRLLPVDLFQLIRNEGSLGHVIGEGEELSQEAVSQAQALRAHLKTSIQAEELALAMVKVGLIRPGSFAAPAVEKAKQFEKPLDVRKRDRKSEIAKVVNSWAYLVGVEVQTIHLEWIRLTGKQSADLTLEELNAKYEWAVNGLAAAQRERSEPD